MYFISLVLSENLSQMVDKDFCSSNVAKILIILNKKKSETFKIILACSNYVQKIISLLKNTHIPSTDVGLENSVMKNF